MPTLKQYEQDREIHCRDCEIQKSCPNIVISYRHKDKCPCMTCILKSMCTVICVPRRNYERTMSEEYWENSTSSTTHVQISFGG